MLVVENPIHTIIIMPVKVSIMAWFTCSGSGVYIYIYAIFNIIIIILLWLVEIINFNNAHHKTEDECNNTKKEPAAYQIEDG